MCLRFEEGLEKKIHGIINLAYLLSNRNYSKQQDGIVEEITEAYPGAKRSLNIAPTSKDVLGVLSSLNDTGYTV